MSAAAGAVFDDLDDAFDAFCDRLVTRVSMKAMAAD